MSIPAVTHAQDPIDIIEDQGQGVITLYGKNKFDMDCEVMIDIESFGLDYSKPEPFTMVIPGGKTIQLIVLTPQPGKAWNYSFNVKYRQIAPDEKPIESDPVVTEPVGKAADQNSWPYTEYGPPDDLKESQKEDHERSENENIYTPPVVESPPVVKNPPAEKTAPARHPENTPPQKPVSHVEDTEDHPVRQPSPPASDPNSDYIPYSDYGPPIYPEEETGGNNNPVIENREEQQIPNKRVNDNPDTGTDTGATGENRSDVIRESTTDLPPVIESREESYPPAPSVNVRPATTSARERAELKGIMLYTEPGCRRCDQARETLNQLGVKFKETSLTQNSIATTGLYEQLKTFGFPGGPISTPVVAFGTELYHDIDDVPAFLSKLIAKQ